jgi:two-component system response regulator DevR
VINIMLVEDHTSFRQAIAFLLDRESGFKVVAQAGTLAEARRLLTKDIDLAVVDLLLPDGSGTEFIKDLRQLNPEAIALVLTATIDPEDPGRAMETGAAEVLHKSVGVGEIVRAVRRLAAGR